MVANSHRFVDHSVWGSFGSVGVDIRASSPDGIVSVVAKFDSEPAVTLTAPNCNRDVAGAAVCFTADAA